MEGNFRRRKLNFFVRFAATIGIAIIVTVVGDLVSVKIPLFTGYVQGLITATILYESGIWDVGLPVKED